MDPPAGPGGVPEPVAFFRQREAELIGFASHAFRLAARASDGVSAERDHLEHAARKGNAAAIAKLRGPAVAPDLRALWDVYLSLQRWRGASEMGAAPITLHDLRAFEERFGYTLTPWEVDVMKALDLTQLAMRSA